jgi:trans-aconitate methyltransferase
MQYEAEFDALFSNASLHWVLDAAAAAKAMARALRPGGRFVAEFGGKGNIQTIEHAIVATVAKYAPDQIPASNNYCPSIGEYSATLENAGLEVRSAELYDRPTPLDGEDGMANWIRQFKWFYFAAVPVAQREQALAEVIEEVRPKLQNAEGWFADYRRLRILAVK